MATDNGHGWVTPNKNGTKARCGGLMLCGSCKAYAEELKSTKNLSDAGCVCSAMSAQSLIEFLTNGDLSQLNMMIDGFVNLQNNSFIPNCGISAQKAQWLSQMAYNALQKERRFENSQKAQMEDQEDQEDHTDDELIEDHPACCKYCHEFACKCVASDPRDNKSIQRAIADFHDKRK